MVGTPRVILLSELLKARKKSREQLEGAGQMSMFGAHAAKPKGTGPKHAVKAHVRRTKTGVSIVHEHQRTGQGRKEAKPKQAKPEPKPAPEPKPTPKAAPPAPKSVHDQHLDEIERLLTKHANTVGLTGAEAREGGKAAEKARKLWSALSDPTTHDYWPKNAEGFHESNVEGEIPGYQPHNRGDVKATVQAAMGKMRADLTESKKPKANWYEAKQGERRERYEDAADKARAKSQGAYQSSRDQLSGIPLGQPILVGHHSEGRARRDMARANNAMRRSVDEQAKSEHYDRKADSVGRGGVSSDDPEAVRKLKVKLASMEATQSHMKLVNKASRAHQKDPTKSLDKHKLSPKQEAQVRAFKPGQYSWENKPYESYMTTNNNANIRRVKQRIETLKAQAIAPVAADREIGGVRLEEHTESNRVRLHFDGKPSAEIRKELKSNGFRWSPRAGAWQRQRSPNATATAERLLKQHAVTSQTVKPGRSATGMTIAEIKAAGKQHLAQVLIERDVAKWGEKERAGLTTMHERKHRNTLMMDVALHYGHEDFRAGRTSAKIARSNTERGFS